MRATPLGLREGDRERLMSLIRSSAVRAGLAQRARIVLLAADGVGHTEIAELAGVSRPTVISWGAAMSAAACAGWRTSRGRAGRGGSTTTGSSPRRCARHRGRWG
jgi:hypothetical protein